MFQCSGLFYLGRGGGGIYNSNFGHRFLCVCVRVRSKLSSLCVITRFRRDVNEIFALVVVGHRSWAVTASGNA